MGFRWDWHEIQDSDIIDVKERYSLEPLYQKKMQSIAWISRQKLN